MNTLSEFLIVVSLMAVTFYGFHIVCILCQFYRSLVVTFDLCNLWSIKLLLLIIEVIVRIFALQKMGSKIHGSAKTFGIVEE
jgi:hypothetical protein